MEYSIQTEKNIPSSQHLMEPSQKLTTYSVTLNNNSVKLSNAHLNHQWVKEEIKREIKDFLKFNENDHTKYPKFMKHNESSVKRKVHSTKCLHKEAGKIAYK